MDCCKEGLRLASLLSSAEYWWIAGSGLTLVNIVIRKVQD